jgi:hypothetical protein
MKKPESKQKPRTTCYVASRTVSQQVLGDMDCSRLSASRGGKTFSHIRIVNKRELPSGIRRASTKTPASREMERELERGIDVET